MACRWHTDKQTGERFHVPECWGTVHDPDGMCHCPDRPLEEDEDVGVRVAELEVQLGRITAALAELRPKGRK